MNLGQINPSKPISPFVLKPETKTNSNICLVPGPEVGPRTGSQLSLAPLLKELMVR